jgi:hypothetical protein
MVRFRLHSSRYYSFVAAGAVLVVCTGCPSTSPVAQVHGKVTLDGKPLAAGGVATIPSGGRGAGGIIKNGEFKLSTFGKDDGALIGSHKVAVIAREQAQGAGPEAKAGKLLVPERYTNPDTSGLSIEVKSGEVNAPTLELKSN